MATMPENPIRWLDLSPVRQDAVSPEEGGSGNNIGRERSGWETVARNIVPVKDAVSYYLRGSQIK